MTVAAAAAAAADDAGRPGAAAARLRVMWRVVRAAEALALAVLLSRSLPLLPVAAGAAGAVLRVGASFLLHPCSVFLLANGIVVLLVALSRRDRPSSSSSSSSSSSCSDDHDDVHDQFLSFAGAHLPPLPAAITGAAAADQEEGAVFEDKQAVHVTPARAAPRRSRSEKVGRGRRPTRAASPELRRSESERCRRRRRSLSSSSASLADWGMEEDDGGEKEEEEFRRAVEAFIAKQQTRFHREESFVLVAGAGAGDETSAAAAAVEVK
ncbi:hypothetical protein [Oryza sativa Japonica Group]|uniref:Uncharacterized protein n=4 Tax=Oryza sativa subsp. japonica TaxID=39947 RepID=A0A979HJF8_ORYSJ|nr:uncharacterized protein LOC9271453 [Oryza sativa Japonica Group]KAB8082594.1 hypothetical protein EE612_004525 [Oryza sativa]KAF2951307.1 hypothetical protein DAI22_01g252501 [Oryza sativa Japonica Group]BAB90418.1 hypothetical protein [Oryza sativa Japonica Group]BAS73305.1 Os01g0632000 [Oryza sativa Japonica Group]